MNGHISKDFKNSEARAHVGEGESVWKAVVLMHHVKRLTDVHAVSSLKVSLIFFRLYLLFAASFLMLHSHLLSFSALAAP